MVSLYRPNRFVANLNGRGVREFSDLQNDNHLNRLQLLSLQKDALINH
jgi:hypothetical protein